jgi:hypothetical protein
VDILQWDYHIFPPKFFDVICAGVPCTEYSIAKTKGQRDLLGTDKLVQITLEIVEYFQPKLWWIENPRTGFLTKRECIQHIPYIDVDYCQFSNWGYQKPTRIWGSPNLLHLGDRLCDPHTCPNVVTGEGGRLRHKRWLGCYGRQVTTQQKWRMPRELVEFLLSAIGEAPRPDINLDFVREDYTIKKEFLQDIEERFGVKIQRDCFSAPHNARCGKFFTKKDDALHQNWETGEVLWLNPPWSLWPKVAKKLRKERCTAICLCPDWEKEWVRKLFRLVTKKFRFEEGTELFEVSGKSMEGIRWGVWALLVEGGPHQKNHRNSETLLLSMPGC